MGQLDSTCYSPTKVRGGVLGGVLEPRSLGFRFGDRHRVAVQLVTNLRGNFETRKPIHRFKG
jgi:hypothetical protein